MPELQRLTLKERLKTTLDHIKEKALQNPWKALNSLIKVDFGTIDNGASSAPTYQDKSEDAPQIQTAVVEDKINHEQADETEPATPIEEQNERVRPQYIDETMQRVDQGSKQQLEQFIYHEDGMREYLRISLEQWAEMQALIDVTDEPEKKTEYEALLADLLDNYTRAPAARAGNRFAGLDAATSTLASVTRKLELDRIKMSLNALNPLWTKRKNELVDRISDELFSRAEDAMRDSGERGNVIVISLDRAHISAILTAKKYSATLERYKLEERPLYQRMRENVEERERDLADGTESSPSRGLSSFERRMLRERQLGTVANEKGAVHPVYGQMSVSEQNIDRRLQEGYGNVELTLKREQIQDRTLFITGDSLSEFGRVGQQLNWIDAAKARVFLDSLMTDKRVDWRLFPPYIEAQVMGEVSFADMKKITMKKDVAGDLTDILSMVPDARVEEDQNEQTITIWFENP